MCKKNNSALFFTCSLIEQLGRTLHCKRGDIASALGEKALGAIYDHADVLHCEPLPKVAEDVAAEFSLNSGSYDNMAKARFSVPDTWTMGKVYARLIEDVSGEDNVVETLMNVYTSWIDEKLSDYNSSLFYEPRDYVAECYRQGMILD